MSLAIPCRDRITLGGIDSDNQFVSTKGEEISENELIIMLSEPTKNEEFACGYSNPKLAVVVLTQSGHIGWLWVDEIVMI